MGGLMKRIQFAWQDGNLVDARTRVSIYRSGNECLLALKWLGREDDMSGGAGKNGAGDFKKYSKKSSYTKYLNKIRTIY